MAQAMAEQPSSGRDMDEFGDGTSVGSGDLTSLVRRWLAVPRSSREDLRPTTRERVPQASRSAPPAVPLPARTPGTALSVELHGEPAPQRSVSPVEGAAVPDGAHPAALEQPLRRTNREGGGRQLTQIARMAVLIDAGTTPPAAATGLFELLADTGEVSLRRAYGDWTGPVLGDWLPRLRQLGIQPVHHFSDQEADQPDNQGLVTMTMDAVDIAREGAVDVVVVVGELRSAPPLVTRLHEAGLRVLGVGPDQTPYAVRSACDDFVSLSSLTASQPLAVGRHRA